MRSPLEILRRITRRAPRTPESASRQSADRVTLAEDAAGDHRALTPIPFPDGLTPIGHSLPRLDPHAVDLRQTITDVVNRLAEAGALDEFTMDVLDNWIDSWHETWVAGVDEHAESRRVTAARLVAVTRENLVRETNELTHLEQKQHAVSADHSAFATELGLAVAPERSESPEPVALMPDADRSVVAQLLLARPAAVIESNTPS